jgi:hypothetical protein
VVLALVLLVLIPVAVAEMGAGEDRRVILSIRSLKLLLLLMRVTLWLLGVIILPLGESTMAPTSTADDGICGRMLLVDGGRNSGSGRGWSSPTNSCCW